MIIASKDLLVTRRNDLEPDDCEIIWIEVSINRESYLFGVFYCPPGSDAGPFVSLHESMLPLPVTYPIVLCGDFNLPEISWSNPSNFMPSTSKSQAFYDLFHDRSFTQLVDEPTRELNTLDLVLSNFPSLVSDVSVVDNLPRCDHSIVTFSLSIQKPHIYHRPRSTYNFKRANFDPFRDLLGMVQWSDISHAENINESSSLFKSLLFNTVDQCIPKIIVKAWSRFRPPWLSFNTIRLIRKKKRLYKSAMRSRKPTDFQKYRKISNQVRTCTRYDHRSYVERLSDDLKSSQRGFWRYLKYKRKGCSANVTSLSYMGNTLQSLPHITNAFNQYYFSSVFTSEHLGSLSQLTCDTMSFWSSESIDHIDFSEDVYRELCKINPNKAYGPDNIHGILSHEGAVWLAEPLFDLFQLSLQSGTLPEEWKCANVTPVFKKGNTQFPSNYRPISLTSLVVKCLERIVHQHMIDFLDNHLDSRQHGFRKTFSCQTQLLTTVHDWSGSIYCKLPLNLSKCKALKLTNKRTSPSFQYSKNNVIVEWVDTFTYLGVIIRIIN